MKTASRPVKTPNPCTPGEPCVVCGGLTHPCYTRGLERWCGFIGTDEIKDFTPVGYEWIGSAPSGQQVFMPLEMAKAREERIQADPQEPATKPAPEGLQTDGDRIPRLVHEYRLLQEHFGPRIRLNSFTQEIEIDGKSVAIDKIKLDLAIDHGVYLKSGRENVQDIVCKLAEGNKYSPVVEYLDACYQQYGDDTSILDGLAERYFGQTPSIYNTFVKRTLIGAVARAYNPGCKMDTALILQGKQGHLKSTWFKNLCGDAWFDDSLGAIGDKDERLKLHRSWFIEWAELETVFTRKDVAATKAFLTCATDHVRPPYARSIQSMARHSIIVGTTNKDEFLTDPTGNRRFWVIPCLQRIPIELLKAERDRIWAAVVALYKAGESCYLSPGEEMAASAIAEEFQTRDPWEDWIANFVEGREAISVREILSDLLKIEPGRQEKGQQMRAADCLRRLGWKRSFEFYKTKRQWVWVTSDPPDPPGSTFTNEVDQPSNAYTQTVLSNPDPPDPPPDQHLVKTANGNGAQPPQKVFTTFAQIGRSGGSGGSEVDRSRASSRSTSDPPPELSKRWIGAWVSTNLGVGQITRVDENACFVEGENFCGSFSVAEVKPYE